MPDLTLPRVTSPVAPRPNPGSEAAVAIGCRCAVAENNHGLTPVRPPAGYWVKLGCPVHAPAGAAR